MKKTTQKYLQTKYTVTKYQMIEKVNLWSCIFLIVSILCGSGFGPPLAFIYEHPHCLIHILIISTTSTLGQLVILDTIFRYGPLTLSVVMTVRQVLTFILSHIVYGHSTNLLSASGAILVFSSLGLKMYREEEAIKRFG